MHCLLDVNLLPLHEKHENQQTMTTRFLVIKPVPIINLLITPGASKLLLFCEYLQLQYLYTGYSEGLGKWGLHYVDPSLNIQIKRTFQALG